MFIHKKFITVISVLLSILQNHVMAGSDCLNAPSLTVPSGIIVSVDSEADLQQAINNLIPNSTILIEPGTYNLTNTLYITVDDVTLRGDSNQCDDVILIGQGMENSNYGNVPHGIWNNSARLKIQNLTIRDVYFHPIQFDSAADSPEIYNLKLIDAGEQFIKGSSGGFGNGVDNGKVLYTIMAYSNSPPTTDHGGGIGYTNGVDIHGGDDWLIKHNLFKNFHTPDDADHLWNPAILMWNGSTNTISDSNTFINVDRAIAYGLVDRGSGTDHFGGSIINNMVYTEPNLFSSSRQANSDGLIIIWDSPQTKVLHNTIMSNSNQNKSIEFRFNTTGSQALNNLGDAPTGSRNGATFTDSGNYLVATPSMFINPSIGDLHLQANSVDAIDQVNVLIDAVNDFDEETRTGLADIGADEWSTIVDVVFVNGFDAP